MVGQQPGVVVSVSASFEREKGFEPCRREPRCSTISCTCNDHVGLRRTGLRVVPAAPRARRPVLQRHDPLVIARQAQASELPLLLQPKSFDPANDVCLIDAFTAYAQDSDNIADLTFRGPLLGPFKLRDDRILG